MRKNIILFLMIGFISLVANSQENEKFKTLSVGFAWESKDAVAKNPELALSFSYNYLYIGYFNNVKDYSKNDNERLHETEEELGSYGTKIGINIPLNVNEFNPDEELFIITPTMGYHVKRDRVGINDSDLSGGLMIRYYYEDFIVSMGGDLSGKYMLTFGFKI